MGKDGILKLIIVPGLVVLLMFIVFSPVLAEEALTLEEALRLGIENNIAIKESEIEKRKAEIDLDSARRAVLPEITFSTSYTRLYLDEDDNMRGLPVVPQDSFGIGEILAQMMAAMQPEEDNYQTAISVQQPIYLGGKLMIARQQAEKALELTELQQRQKKNELLFNIIQSYYNILLAEERVRIEEDALELIREHK
ncbi:MAG: TolC family protein, partial [Halanaerobiales bacterium]